MLHASETCANRRGTSLDEDIDCLASAVTFACVDRGEGVFRCAYTATTSTGSEPTILKAHAAGPRPLHQLGTKLGHIVGTQDRTGPKPARRARDRPNLGRCRPGRF